MEPWVDNFEEEIFKQKDRTMKRQLKFRAWNKEEKKMLDSKKLSNTAVSFSGEINKVYPLINLATTLETNEVLDLWVLQQFTGLLDKNGEEIYEGDILETYNFDSKKRHITVKWFTYGFNLGGLTEFGPCEVIGNIFENPELLQ